MNQNKNNFTHSNGFPIGAIYKLLILISKGVPDFQAPPYYGAKYGKLKDLIFKKSITHPCFVLCYVL